LKGKNFDSMVIVVPLHVSKFFRVLKKLAAYLVEPHFSVLLHLEETPAETSKMGQVAFNQQIQSSKSIDHGPHSLIAIWPKSGLGTF
jgi:hypothetical protein